MSELVSVLMPTFNRAAFIAESIDAILAQTYSNVELIVIDDGSTDATEQVLLKYQGRLAYTKIANSGKAEALNVGLSMANGEFILVMDDDDIALPHAIQLGVEELKKQPCAGLTYSSHYRAVNMPGNRIGPKTLVSVPRCAPEAVFPTLLERMFFTHQACLVRKSCYVEIGGFNPAMKRSQDYDVLLRLTRKYMAVGIRAPTVVIRMHEGARGPAGERFDSRERAMRGWRYLTPLYRQLYESLSLEEYLPRTSTDRAWTPCVHREALIRRMSVMMRKGVWDCAIADLREIVEKFSQRGPLSDAEVAACRGAMRNPPALLGLTDNADARRAFQQVLSVPGAGKISRHFLKGSYWASRELSGEGNFADASRAFLSAMELAATAWIARAAKGVLIY